MIRVFIVAASTLVRAGLQNVLADSRFNIAGSAANLESLSEQLADLETDVVLIETPADGHEELLDALAVGDIMSDYATIVLADQVSPGWTAEALRAGIRAVLPSDVSPEQLRAALEATAAGLVVMHPREASAALPAPAATAAPLSELPNARWRPRQQGNRGASFNLGSHRKVPRCFDPGKTRGLHAYGSRFHRHPPGARAALNLRGWFSHDAAERRPFEFYFPAQG